MLAIAMNNLGIQQDKQRLLVDELPKEFGNMVQPGNFLLGDTNRGSLHLGTAYRSCAGLERVRDRLLRLMESSASLSTQENLWLLIAFKAMMKATPVPQSLEPVPNPKPFLPMKAPRLEKARPCEVGGFHRQRSETRRQFCAKAEYRTAEKQTKLSPKALRSTGREKPDRRLSRRQRPCALSLG
jgi:hypothetical protein